MNKSTVLVIMITYNAKQWINKTLCSLRKSSIIPDIYIVDNGSSDGTQEVIKECNLNITFVQSEINLGFAAANNKGFNYALKKGYDFVYLLNQDAWIFEDTLEVLMETSLKHPELGILSPLQMTGALDKLEKGFYKICPKEFIQNMNENSFQKDVYPTNFVMAAHWLVPISVIKIVGAFSPTFFHYGEDSNYVDRMHFHNYEVGIVPLAKAVHDREWRVQSREKQLYLVNVFSLFKLSNPNSIFIFNFFLVFVFAFYHSLKYISIIPITGFIKHIKKLGKIYNNYRQSQEIGAFLCKKM